MYDINWKIGGIGGMGAMGVGYIFAKTLLRSGYYVTDYNEYNSIIKGGHNTYQVRSSHEKIYIISQKIDILLALDEFSLSYNKDLSINGFILCDWAQIKHKENINANQIIDIPFSIINKKNGGDEIMKNIIGLGASCALMGINKDIVFKVIEDQFNNKGNEIIEKNKLLLNSGYDYILENYISNLSSFQKNYGKFELKAEIRDKQLITGNDGISLGAIKQGIGYYSAYPMTPSSSILHFMALAAKDYNIVVKHAEDEIAAINSAIGASYAGTRSMVATSGGGFSLMVEALGMAAMTETPIVIGMISRPGPSTGLPTWTDQSDLRFVLHASQGEFIRVVFTPGDVEECFELTRLAFIITEKFHIPVIILSDKYLAESRWSCYIDENSLNDKRYGFIAQAGLTRLESYMRYEDTPSGITPRSIPGMEKGEFLANSDEHDFYGLTSESKEMRNIQMNKRINKKLSRLVDDLPDNKIYGNLNSALGIICFGSMKNQMLEVLKYISDVKFLSLKYVSPFPVTEVKRFINSCTKFIVIENNLTAQLSGLITEHTGQMPNANILKDDGRPIFYEDILKLLKENGYC